MRVYIFLIGTLLLLGLSAGLKPKKPQLFLIGDSTVKNGSGTGADALWGWGSLLHEKFDTSKISIHNHAIGGRSSRTFLTEGRWEKVMAQLQKGDYVLIQFGHNDAGAINDTSRARGSIKGTGNETEEIFNLLTKKQETVHSYGWYLRKYIDETKAKGATPIICSPVPRNSFKAGKIERPESGYVIWAKEVAAEKKVPFIDLFNLIANHYEQLGQEHVATRFFTSKDHTHTTHEGAGLNALAVCEGISQLKKCNLKKYLLK